MAEKLGILDPDTPDFSPEMAQLVRILLRKLGGKTTISMEDLVTDRRESTIVVTLPSQLADGYMLEVRDG